MRQTDYHIRKRRRLRDQFTCLSTLGVASSFETPITLMVLWAAVKADRSVKGIIRRSRSIRASYFNHSSFSKFEAVTDCRFERDYISRISDLVVFNAVTTHNRYVCDLFTAK